MQMQVTLLLIVLTVTSQPLLTLLYKNKFISFADFADLIV